MERAIVAGRIRIVLVTPYFPAHLGGIERIAGLLAFRLARHGAAQIEWHASDCDSPPPDTAELRCVPQRSCNATERRFNLPYPLWSPRALWRMARAIRTADVLHLHDCLYLPNLAAYAAARLTGRPVVVSQHVGLIPYRSAILRALMSTANRVLGALVLRGARHVVFDNETVRRYFSRLVRFRTAPVLVTNGVDTDEFAPADSQRRARLRAELGVPPDRPLLLFVGRFVEKKGLHILQALAERVAGAHWLLAGWGPLDPAGWRRPNVTVVYRPSASELAPLYQAADLLVLPSVGEGFPLVIQESMACGTPALVGEEAAAGCPEAAAVVMAERVGPEDTAIRWAARIEALLASPASLEALRPGVAAFARENWSWAQCVERYAKVFRSCVVTR